MTVWLGTDTQFDDSLFSSASQRFLDFLDHLGMVVEAHILYFVRFIVDVQQHIAVFVGEQRRAPLFLQRLDIKQTYLATYLGGLTTIGIDFCFLGKNGVQGVVFGKLTVDVTGVSTFVSGGQNHIVTVLNQVVKRS